MWRCKYAHWMPRADCLGKCFPYASLPLAWVLSLESQRQSCDLQVLPLEVSADHSQRWWSQCNGLWTKKSITVSVCHWLTLNGYWIRYELCIVCRFNRTNVNLAHNYIQEYYSGLFLIPGYKSTVFGNFHKFLLFGIPQ